MDVLGDYLYIIVFLGIIVVNILKNLRKQKPVAVPDFSGNHPVSRENKDKEFFGDSFPLSQESTVHVQPVHNKRKNVEMISPKNELKHTHTDNVKEKEENNDSISAVTFNNRDDARRAFIYSEIWNRKY